VLAKLVGAALPDVSDAPADLKPELARMTWLDTQGLWAIAQTTMTVEQQTQLRQLTELQTQRDLTREEDERLNYLRKLYGRIMLLKAHAFALLSLRGGHLLLAEN
jgi:hypothetical protein